MQHETEGENRRELQFLYPSDTYKASLCISSLGMLASHCAFLQNRIASKI